jgi:uncharacterized repeat protein (TIGR03833 family)
MQRVPTIGEVLPGAWVNIVLKADQPTGRTVSGAIKDVLTRGNHPRGIKVRLTDGRIGRVQAMANASASAPPQASEESTHEGPHGARPPRSFSQSRPSAFADIRDEGQPTASIGLDAYVKPAKQRKSGKGKPRQASDSAGAAGTSAQETGATVSSESGAVSTCPVCGTFEGDAAAVAHHVASHFDD